ncbi:MAG: AMMECR1 domain-containing protein, partial [Anaerolineaceae bacterium]|nr:AMMECR1 domain-containing protein [Anaerolineaceae bacterium]
MDNPLSEHEKDFLLTLARQTILKAVNQHPLPTWQDADLTDALSQKGASFVTLTMDGDLRGCIGSLEAYQSLVEDVREHARQA